MINWQEIQTIVKDKYGSRLSTAALCRYGLITAIKTGLLSPGTRLIESELGAAMAISRTPLREALASLRAEGLLEHDEKGLAIRQLDWRAIHDLYEMRKLLEGAAAKGAALHASTAEASVIDQLITQEQTLIDNNEAPAILAEHNARFHQAILQAAKNPFLAEALERLSHLLILLGSTAYNVKTRVNDIQNEHAAINEAIQKGDGSLAEQAMHKHLEQALVARLSILAQIDAKIMD